MEKEKKSIFWRAYLIYFGFVAIMLVVLFKTFSIQMEGRTNMLSNSEEKLPTRIIKRIPRRGEILDAHFTPLVTSVSFYNIHLDPTVCEEKLFTDSITDLSRGLSRIYPSMSTHEWEVHIRRGRERGNRYLLISSKATSEERRQLKALPIFNKGRMGGGLIDTDETSIRKRPHNELLKRTLGYFKPAEGNSPELRVGIEGAYNAYLAGEEGEEIEQKISTGWKKTGRIVKEAVEGADVITSIDKEIQEVAHSELYQQLKAHNAKSGCAIVMDVKTGFVKAIVNLSQANDGEFYELYNHAIGTKEVPGSTFKLASLMAALEEDKISIDDTVTAASRYNYLGKTITEAHGNNYGRISIKRAFELSSNVISKVIYKAFKDEPQTFVDKLKSFGLGQPLGIELEGEADPTLYQPGSRNWWRGSLAWMAVGYEVQQTPLQTLAFYNAVANNGRFLRPQFVKEIRRGSEIVKEFQPYTLKSQICSKSTLKTLKECLEGVMKEGTGKRLTSSFFKIAGKTGTAEIQNDDMRYGAKGEKRYLASFVGYFPVSKPIYSCIVSITASGENIYGATVSGTVFSAIANKVYATSLKYHHAINEAKKKIYETPISKDGNRHDLVNVMKRLKIPFKSSSEGEWINTYSDGKVIEIKKRNIAKGVVPNVIGLSAKDAVYLIENIGMYVSIKGFGTVIKQSSPAGTPSFHGGLIELTLE
ncbi:MAG: transpeptidase family protein [Flavobacteriia bacterium]|nr:transpeptidase family protein [Flavobacteriia bacterium]